MAETTGPGGGPQGDPSPLPIRKLEFSEDVAFQKELRRRVDEYFLASGRRRRDCPEMYLKTFIVLVAFVASYALLVFAVHSWWQAGLLSAVMGLCTAGIGFNIQHDGGHGAYSDRAWVNRAAAWTLDLAGSSSGRWHWKHTVIHHMYVNITGYDDDVDLGYLGRYSPHLPRVWYERWQHLYLWAFYGFLAVKMQLVDDFRYVISGRFGRNHVPRPTGWDLVTFILGKSLFVAWAFVIPMLLHPWWAVLLCYLVGATVLGIVLTLVFIIPHLVDLADFPLPRPDAPRIDVPWAVHQARATVDFAVESRVLTWMLGGLNYHKEHHLFPLICHVNYPGMSKVVAETCREFGVPYNVHPSFFAGIAAHYRWLRRMGRDDPGGGAPAAARRGG